MSDPANLLSAADRCLLWILTALTLLCFLLTVIVPLRAVRRQRSVRRRRKKFSGLLTVALFLLMVLTLQRYAVGYYVNRLSLPDADGLNAAERAADSLLHGLQTFSMDEDYTRWLADGKAMMTALCGGTEQAGTVYGLILSLLHVAAPVIGGAFILNILMSFLPKLRLALIEIFCGRRRKFYFSELNTRSLALAESICSSNAAASPLRRPCIIFTDSYPDSEDEARSEMLDSARALGAICLREDLLRIISRRGKGRTKEYILIDENELNNIKTLAALADDAFCAHLDSTVIRIFYSNDSFSLTEQQIIGRIRDSFRRRFHGDEEKVRTHMPAVDRVRGAQNMIYRLLTSNPLYEPLLTSPDPAACRTLNVGIVGFGGIGTEMLLAASWCGQMPGITLGINTVSLGSAEDFCARLDRINPELRQSAAAGSPLLRVYPDDDGKPQVLNEPYMTLRYCQADATAGDIAALTCTALLAPDGIPDSAPDSLRLIDCDYLLVALGSDEKNIETAERLRRAAAADRVRSGSRRRVFIACVVYDADLAETLNSSPDSIGTSGSMIRTQAVGSLRDIYSSDNILLKSTERSAQILNRSYEAQRTPDLAGKMLTRAQNVYNYMSSTARAVHIRYKMFAALRFLRRKEDAESLRENLTAFTQFRTAEALSAPEAVRLRQTLTEQFAGLIRPETGDPQLNALLSWNEHRRWNAYMRSLGFMHRSDLQPKDIALRLHPTIVETKNPLTEPPEREDLLDRFSSMTQTNYKAYDNPLRDLEARSS
ncbi:MAG: hypothetical protein II723_05160 [Oscillospiraceae bacterium]|nr:hypothetical protein [Oscillospiraceae bacterium]